MDIETILQKISNLRSGTFQVIQEREVEPLKKHRDKKITKRNLLYARNVNYNHQKSVQEKRVEGMGHRDSNLRKVAEMVYKDERNGSLKFCFCPSKLRNHRSKSKWYLNGKEVDYLEIEEYLSSRDRKKKDGSEPEYYTLKLDTVRDILQKGKR